MLGGKKGRYVVCFMMFRIGLSAESALPRLGLSHVVFQDRDPFVHKEVYVSNGHSHGDIAMGTSLCVKLLERLLRLHPQQEILRNKLISHCRSKSDSYKR